MNLRDSLLTHRPPPFRTAALCSVAALWLAAPLAGPALAQSDAALPCGVPHVVASGDTLSKLAARAYGDPALYRAIAEANRETLGGDAGDLAVGMSLMIPCRDGGKTATSPAQAAGMRAAIAAEGTLTPDQLDTLFGPVALFPDPLLTPVLVAVTFPLDVVKAARFVEENEGETDKERVQLAAAEPWDNSVRELAAGFPDVVTRMSDNIDWTEQAGEAVVAQTDEVLASIQRLRAKAKTNGYLVDNQAQKVEEVNDKIVIAPAEPNVVYVPTYDSQVVYSQPVSSPPVYHYGYDYNDNWSGWGNAMATGGIILGGAVLLDEIFDDDDWHGWDHDDDIDWNRGDITIDRGDRDITIDRDNLNIDRDRVRIGDRERIDRDRGDLALGAGAGAALGAGAGAALANRSDVRKSLSNPADRAAARQKIESRKAKGVAPAKLDATRKAKAGTQAKARAANAKANRPAAGTRGTAAKAKAKNVSRPKANRAPAARAPNRSNVFKKPSGGGSRAKMSSNRGRASMGGRGGGGRGGGGGRRR